MGLGLGSSYCGRWHVVYADGQRSQGMTLETAKNYFHIFESKHIEAKFWRWTVYYRGFLKWQIK